jgi:putative membrane protein
MSNDQQQSGGGKSLLDKAQDMIGAAVGMSSASTMGSHSAGAFVKNAVIANRYEIEAAQIALQRGRSPEIRELAQKMIKDHQMLGSKMKSAVPAMDGVDLPDEQLDNRRQGMIDNLRDAPEDSFDQRYLDQQLAAHREAVTLFSGYADNGDNPELKGLAASAVPILQDHLDHVTRLKGY